MMSTWLCSAISVWLWSLLESEWVIPHTHAHFHFHLGCYLLSPEYKEDCTVFRKLWSEQLFGFAQLFSGSLVPQDRLSPPGDNRCHHDKHRLQTDMSNLLQQHDGRVFCSLSLLRCVFQQLSSVFHRSGPRGGNKWQKHASSVYTHLTSLVTSKTWSSPVIRAETSTVLVHCVCLSLP